MADPVKNLDDISVTEDVLWVYKHLGARVTESTPGVSPARKKIWEWAQDDEAVGARKSNQEKFLDLAQKAESIYRKERRDGDAEAVEKAETKSVAEYQRILDEIISQSEYEPLVADAIEPPKEVDFEF